jgi:hypothetical protein
MKAIKKIKKLRKLLEELTKLLVTIGLLLLALRFMLDSWLMLIQF